MTTQDSAVATEGRLVHANGIDINIFEAGDGEPLLLLHGGIVSASPMWGAHPFAYAGHIATLAEHFHVIAPDARGYGRTVNAPGGPISYALLADDLVALVAALDLDRPRVAGFSDGAIAATVTAIGRPDLFGALVNHSGYDYFNPQAETYAVMRQTLGGSPQATRADPEAAQRFFASSPQMQATFELMKADHDGAQGEGHWRTLISETFDRCTQWPGHTFDDLAAIAAPTLILTGDRDQFCTVEEGVAAYRALPAGELAVLPNTGHLIAPAHIEAMIAFLTRV